MAQEAQVVEEKAEDAQDQQPDPQSQDDSKTQAQAVELSEVSPSGTTSAGSSIDVLLDMTVPVTAVIDKKDVSVQRLLQLGPGSVLKLDKPVGAPIDLYLKNVRFATATAVVIDDRFAVKIKEICGTGLAADPAAT